LIWLTGFAKSEDLAREHQNSAASRGSSNPLARMATELGRSGSKQASILRTLAMPEPIKALRGVIGTLLPI
jgi:hypothetical protein